MPIRRTTSVSRNVRPALELSPDLSEEACDAVVFLAGYPGSAHADQAGEKCPRGRGFAGGRKRTTLARTSLLEPRILRAADRLPPNCHGTCEKTIEGC